MSSARTSRLRPFSRRAVTLVEALIAMLILAGAVVAVSQAVLAGQMQSADAVHRRRAVELATTLMEEIVRLPYNDPDGASSPGPEAGESNRSAYDNLDDFHGFTEAAGALKDMKGAAYDSAYQTFSRSVTVVATSVSIAGLGSAQTGVEITVTVTDATGRTWSVEQFIPEPVEP